MNGMKSRDTIEFASYMINVEIVNPKTLSEYLSWGLFDAPLVPFHHTLQQCATNNSRNNTGRG